MRSRGGLNAAFQREERLLPQQFLEAIVNTSARLKVIQGGIPESEICYILDDFKLYRMA